MATIGRARQCAESQINNPLPRALYDEADEKENEKTHHDEHFGKWNWPVFVNQTEHLS